jgi:hypothetical protein
MPISTFRVKSVSATPERRQNRHSRLWFKVWTIEREPDDRLPIGESLAGYETTSEWAWSLCGRAKELGLPVTVLWKDSPYMRQIVEVTLAHKESAA